MEGSGSVDLRAEKFALLLVPKVKNTELMPLGSAIRVEGTLKHADISIDKSTARPAPAPALDSPGCIASASRR